jgi:simple sugar transport system ATP-binding protein
MSDLPMGERAGAQPLRLENVRKDFGGVTAVLDVSLEVRRGEILSLVGDNGAGKSTLIKMISGAYAPTSGRILLDGHPVHFKDATHARDHGIEVVYQDLALAESQPVYMNLFLGREIVRGPLRRLDRRAMVAATQALIDELDVRIPSARALVRDLSGGQRQAVAIVRATRWATGIVLMDEPTAALGVAETAKVEELILTLRAKGLAILVISHNLEQVFRISDRVAVLRRGVHVNTVPTAQTDQNDLVAMITGVGRRS